LSSTTSDARDGYFEDFEVGDRMRHARGRTVVDADLAFMTLLVMNTADGHFNEHSMADTDFGHRINFGGLTLSLVVGLSANDTAAQAIAEIGLDEVRLPAPVMVGDTIYASTEVVELRPAEQPNAGIVVFRHWGFNQRDELVCEALRTVLIKARPAEAAA
jgi:acyl dehydratase